MNSVLPGLPIINAHSPTPRFRYSRSLQQFVNVSPKRQAVLLLYRKVRRLLRAGLASLARRLRRVAEENRGEAT